MKSQEIPNEKLDFIIGLYVNGNPSKALDEIDNLILNYPNNPLLFNISGACYASLGKIQKGIESYEMAIAIKPDFIDALFNLANLYRKAHNLKNAIIYYQNIINIMPDHGPAQINLGISLEESGLINEAIDHYEVAKKCNPKNIDIFKNLGALYLDSGQYENAIFEFENALTINPNDDELNNNLGVSLRELGHFIEAKEYLKKSISINDQYSKAHYNLGFLYQDIGSIDKAIVHFEKAISINNHSMSFHSLSYLKIFKKDDALVIQMQDLLNSDKLNQVDKIHICHAMANIHEKLNNHTEFFRYLDNANNLHKKELNYSHKASKQEFKAIKKIFDTSTKPIETRESNSALAKQPIFIVGMPRSGTSLVEQILASHNEVFAVGEINTMTRLSSPIISNFIAGDIKQLDIKSISYIRKEYIETMNFHETKKKFITDKLPLNFKNIGFIFSAFPEAKIIHVNRDATATCWSNYRYYFESKNNGYSNNFEDLAQFYSLYKELMKFWDQLYPNKIYELNYENLTSNQEEVTRDLLKYCNLDWDENCLKFYENERAVKTISTLQVRKKMYQGSSNAWKKYDSYLKPLIDNLNSI